MYSSKNDNPSWHHFSDNFLYDVHPNPVVLRPYVISACCFHRLPVVLLSLVVVMLPPDKTSYSPEIRDD